MHICRACGVQVDAPTFLAIEPTTNITHGGAAEVSFAGALEVFCCEAHRAPFILEDGWEPENR